MRREQRTIPRVARAVPLMAVAGVLICCLVLNREGGPKKIDPKPFTPSHQPATADQVAVSTASKDIPSTEHSTTLPESLAWIVAADQKSKDPLKHSFGDAIILGWNGDFDAAFNRLREFAPTERFEELRAEILMFVCAERLS